MVRPRLYALLVALGLIVGCGRPDDGVRIESLDVLQLPPPTENVLPIEVRAPRTFLAIPAAAAPDPGEDPAIRAAILDALGDQVEHYGVVVRRLRDGRGAAINPDRVFYAASLFKLALLYEAERRRSAGRIAWEGPIQVSAGDLSQDLGTFASLGVGPEGTLPLRAAVGAMVTRSDNVSAVLVLRLLEPASVDRTLTGLGLRDTSLNTRELPTTAADMALLMEAIVRGYGVDPAWREDMVGLLLNQEARYGIPRGLPPGIPSGNKTGTWANASHDVAFVDAPEGLYVIAVLSDRGWDFELTTRVSRAVFEALANDE